MKKTIKTAFLKSLPIMAGYIPLGFGFGILLANAGYGIFWSLAMSITIYAGSMQYVGVSLLASHASLITTAITTLLVQARHFFYGISLIDRYKGVGKKKIYMMLALTDETYSLVCGTEVPSDIDKHNFDFFVSLFDHIWWVAGCSLGVIVGGLITFNSMGIEFVMTALFITVFIDQWKKAKNHLAAIIGVISSIICLLIFGPGNFLIPAMLVISFFLIVGKKKIEEGEPHAA